MTQVPPATLAFAGGPQLWPLTAGGGLYREKFGKVTRALAGRQTSAQRREFASLSDAVTGTAAEFSLGRDDVTYLVATSGDDWTAAFSASFPLSEVQGYFADRARLDVKCDYAGYDWTPASPPGTPPLRAVLAGALFLDYRHASRWRRNDRLSGDMRTLQVSDQGDGWTFDALGPERDYEQLDSYSARRRADRLPLALIERYLEAVGVPVRDEQWLSGPVLALAKRRDYNRPDWSTIAELRAGCGYPEAGIPQRLTGWAS